MPRRCNDNSSEEDPPKKRNCSSGTLHYNFKPGTILKDITGKEWKLGKPVGVGGFGQIYLASDDLTKEVKSNCEYVAKIEHHKNGPLFVEMNCYLRIAKLEMIEKWMEDKKLDSLGMPHYVASGSHLQNAEKYRFLIIPKFDKDLEKVLQEKKTLDVKSVLTISQQVIDVLEYIHSKGYIHSDIKASNILSSDKKVIKKKKEIAQPLNHPIRACRIKSNKINTTRISRNLRLINDVKYVDDIPHLERLIRQSERERKLEQVSEKKNQFYLLDYGLACKFVTSKGDHKPFCSDERRAHAGTILFCSRDAHKGALSRRSDLESLGYNIIFWLTGTLPWFNDTNDPLIVQKKKQRAMMNLPSFLNSCFNDYPNFLEDYFNYLNNLNFQEKPDYKYCKKIFREALKETALKKISKKTNENYKVCKFHTFSRIPLQSNIPVKPLLRKKIKNDTKKKKKSKWFDVLDPEEILKQAREKKINENNDFVSNIADLKIKELNPTYAMIEVYNKSRDREYALPSCKGDSTLENTEGYTSAMMSVLQKMRQRKEIESEKMAVNTKTKVIRRCVSKRRKNVLTPVKTPKVRTTKSTSNRNFERKVCLRRSYSLRVLTGKKLWRHKWFHCCNNCVYF